MPSRTPASPGRLARRLRPACMAGILFTLVSCAHVEEAQIPEGLSTHARFVPERADDFAWENDKIAFRAYGPALRDSAEDSGFDAWLKRVPYPIVDKWYAGHLEGVSYHTDHGEGYDPYKVGGSRGCGGLALWMDQQLISSNVFNRWEVVKATPAETVFRLFYTYEHGGDTYEETKEISIRLGDRLFRSTSTFLKNGAPAAHLPIAIGLVRQHLNDTVVSNQKEGWMAVWDTIDGSELGTGVVIDPARIDSFFLQTGPDALDDHALLLTKTDANGQLTYHAGYGWARAGEITTLDAWLSYLTEFSEKH